MMGQYSPINGCLNYKKMNTPWWDSKSHEGVLKVQENEHSMMGQYSPIMECLNFKKMNTPKYVPLRKLSH